MSALRFERPPVRHVHLTLTFEPQEKLQVSHLSSLREAWRETYPRTRERAPLPSDEDDLVRYMGRGSSWPFPYLIFGGEDRSVIIERDKFALTWTFGDEGSPYPTYERLKVELGERYAEFAATVASELGAEPTLTGSSCQYTNLFPGEDPTRTAVGILTRWAVDTNAGLAPSQLIYQGFRQHQEGSDATQGTDILLGVDMSQDEPDSVELFIETSRNLSEGEELLLAGLDVAHEVLIDTFLTCTREDQQTAWGRTE